MTNSNQVPTAPGWWYRDYPDEVEKIVYVWDCGAGLIYYTVDDDQNYRVEDDGLWRGPVPMPGEWVSRKEYDELIRNLDDRI